MAIYCNPNSAVAAKAEEGLSLHLQPRPPFTPSERISNSYPSASELPLLEDEHGFTPADLVTLDTEGRALVLDFGLFVLVNVYCPNDASDERLTFKVNYLIVLENRVKTLIEEGRDVIVVGDINVAATPLDHCDGRLESKRKEWYSHPARDWFRKWLVPIGPMHDVIREAWPDRREMYTCPWTFIPFSFLLTCGIGWNTKIQARDTNYGTRIDYVLMTSNLLPWVKGADILTTVRGSDHCPIYVDLHDDIPLPSGEIRVLRKELGALSDDLLTPPIVTSRLAARFWNEWSGKQTLLSSFFNKGKGTPQMSLRGYESSGLVDNIAPSAQDAQERSKRTKSTICTETKTRDSHGITNKAPADTSLLTDVAYSSGTPRSQQPSTKASAVKKRKLVNTSLLLAPKRSRPGQARLSSFFTKPSALSGMPKAPHNSPKSNRSNAAGQEFESEFQVGNSRSMYYIISDDESSSQRESTSSSNVLDSRSMVTESPIPEGVENQANVESDHGYAGSLSQSSNEASSSARSKANGVVAWQRMMAPIEAPRCTVHNEPAKLLTVNKPGPNKDKKFFICSR